MKAESQLDLSALDLGFASELIIWSFIDLPVNLVESAAIEIKFAGQFMEKAVAEYRLNCSVCAIKQIMNWRLSSCRIESIFEFLVSSSSRSVFKPLEQTLYALLSSLTVR